MNKTYRFLLTGFFAIFFFFSFFQSSQAGFFDWFGSWFKRSDSLKPVKIIPNPRNTNSSLGVNGVDDSGSNKYPFPSSKSSSAGLSSSSRSFSSVSSRRNKYNSSSSSSRGSSTLTVLSPNGGESWIKGTKQEIRWQDNSGKICKDDYCPLLEAQVMYDIKLIPYYPPCVGQYCPAAPYIAPHIIAKVVRGSSYNWSVGDITDVYGASGSIYNGKYTVQVCVANSTYCDLSDSYFKIISNSASASSGFSM